MVGAEFKEDLYEENADRAFIELDCVAKANWEFWAEVAKFAEPESPTEILELFCSDCEVVYRNKMRKAGLCRKPSNGWPKI